MNIKFKNKERLAAYIKEHNGVEVDPRSIFDVQVKRLHEYKRQLLNILHVMYLYNQIKEHPEMSFYPKTYVFGAKASAGYILPADKQATVKVDATAIVQMHNEFRDTPKTGDDFNLGLWVSLAVLSVVGAGVLGFVGYKDRKKKKED